MQQGSAVQGGAACLEGMEGTEGMEETFPHWHSQLVRSACAFLREWHSESFPLHSGWESFSPEWFAKTGWTKLFSSS